ncbi:MAG: hypothetical protein IJR82_00350 [Bacilli bacterium]|nr:hypothetical protein [Bacilli bacterium]
MRNTINYFYGLVLDNIHQKKDLFYFKYDGYLYMLVSFNNDVGKMFGIYSYLITNKIYCHEIIRTKENNILSIINNRSYCLLKVYYNYQDEILIDNIVSYNIILDKNKRCDWDILWSQKLDYYELQVREFGKKYSLILESFSYYNGLCESAIVYLKNINIKEVDMYLNHRRIDRNMNLVDFYNPLNFVTDVKIRDACEYFKSQFFIAENILPKINQYLLLANLSFNESVLFFARFLYPSYYFDMYDNIIKGNIEEKKLSIYTSKIDNYELFLSRLYMMIRKYFNIPSVDWLIKT